MAKRRGARVIGTVSTEDKAALAQTSFGQRDVRVTPLQAAMISAAVANGGTLMHPFLVRRIESADGTVLYRRHDG